MKQNLQTSHDHISCLAPEQIAQQDPDVCVQGVRDQEGIVPRPFSQLHPLCPLPGHGLYHLRVHEAGSPPELVPVFIPPKSEPVCSESSNRSNASSVEWLTHFVLNDVGISFSLSLLKGAVTFMPKYGNWMSVSEKLFVCLFFSFSLTSCLTRSIKGED